MNYAIEIKSVNSDTMKAYEAGISSPQIVECHSKIYKPFNKCLNSSYFMAPAANVHSISSMNAIANVQCNAGLLMHIRFYSDISNTHNLTSTHTHIVLPMIRTLTLSQACSYAKQFITDRNVALTVFRYTRLLHTLTTHCLRFDPKNKWLWEMSWKLTFDKSTGRRQIGDDDEHIQTHTSKNKINDDLRRNN